MFGYEPPIVQQIIHFRNAKKELGAGRLLGPTMTPPNEIVVVSCRTSTGKSCDCPSILGPEPTHWTPTPNTLSLPFSKMNCLTAASAGAVLNKNMNQTVSGEITFDVDILQV